MPQINRPSTSQPRGQARSRAATAAVVLLAALMSGCTGSSGATSESAGGAALSQGAVPAAKPADGSAVDRSDGTAAGSPASGTGSSARTAVTPKMAKRATLRLLVTNLADAAARVRAVAAAQRGYVLRESIGSSKPPSPEPVADSSAGYGEITLSVPAASLDATLAELAKVGTVQTRSTEATDVTTQYVDTESRLKTMRASLERVRALMAQATSIGQVVSLESELAQREADLESLESQLAALKGDVERSTVSVSLSTPGHRADTEDPDGFLAGLSAGWQAFLDSAQALLTAVGAVLPFAVFLVAVGYPAMTWLRRRRAVRPVQALSTSAPPSSPPAPDAS